MLCVSMLFESLVKSKLKSNVAFIVFIYMTMTVKVYPLNPPHIHTLSLIFLTIFFQEDLTEEEKKGNVSIFQVNCNLYIIALQAIKPVYFTNEKQELVELDMYS